MEDSFVHQRTHRLFFLSIKYPLTLTNFKPSGCVFTASPSMNSLYVGMLSHRAQKQRGNASREQCSPVSSGDGAGRKAMFPNSFFLMVSNVVFLTKWVKCWRGHSSLEFWAKDGRIPHAAPWAQKQANKYNLTLLYLPPAFPGEDMPRLLASSLCLTSYNPVPHRFSPCYKICQFLCEWANSNNLINVLNKIKPHFLFRTWAY